MLLKALSIHAHFYQPPREDPLTGVVPYELGADPYPNWNARIHAECYLPNAQLQNFRRISFNIGPTLVRWMERHDRATTQKIVDQDRANFTAFGVGNAMAQPYNHTILPLNSYRDKVTQVRWGLADFEHRFGRKSQGMWLPETAVDTETLEVLARHQIEFTILAPWQAEAQNLDVTEPYRVLLPNSQKINVFFYHAELSARVSFDPQSTTNADFFAQNFLKSQFDPEKTRRGEPQLLIIASDGELYGHHQTWRDQFLARLVNGAGEALEIANTYPGRWLKDHPPRQDVRIHERTSWSCHHGVKRWMGQCECTPGNGAWKTELRQVLDLLANELDQMYLTVTQPFFKDPWELRNRYIHVMLGEMRIDTLLGEMSERPLNDDEINRVHLILEAQHERQRMYTSCGWFFEDFDRIEPRNSVAYAAQAVFMAYLATGVDLTPQLLPGLKRVSSQRSRLRADSVYTRHWQRAQGA